jgi:hypothetical protein
MLACQQTAYPAPPEPASIPWDNIPILPEFCMELGHSLTDQNSFAARLLNAPGRAVEASNTNWRTGDRGKRLEWHSGWDWGNLKLFLKQQAISLYRFRRFR